jgi:hypothetical protein
MRCRCPAQTLSVRREGGRQTWAQVPRALVSLGGQIAFATCSEVIGIGSLGRRHPRNESSS